MGGRFGPRVWGAQKRSPATRPTRPTSHPLCISIPLSHITSHSPSPCKWTLSNLLFPFSPLHHSSLKSLIRIEFCSRRFLESLFLPVKVLQMINELFVQIWRAPPVLAATKSATNETKRILSKTGTWDHGWSNGRHTTFTGMLSCSLQILLATITLIIKYLKTWQEAGNDILTLWIYLRLYSNRMWSHSMLCYKQHCCCLPQGRGKKKESVGFKWTREEIVVSHSPSVNTDIQPRVFYFYYPTWAISHPTDQCMGFTGIESFGQMGGGDYKNSMMVGQ